MDMVIVLGGLIAVFMLYRFISDHVITDAVINLAQAQVDASRCKVFMEQLSNPCESHEEVCFDLPFISLSVQPTYWWDAVWCYDFIARTMVMQYANEYTTVVWEE